MLPNPLHPAVVHFPIVLAVLLPIAALLVLFLIRRGGNPRTLWAGVVVGSAMLAGSAWLALETGEGQEEQVESVVPDQALDTHEEAADRLLLLSILVLGMGMVGLAGGKVGTIARVMATVGAIGVLPASYSVGHSGGELVYVHGAASAYATSPSAQGGVESRRTGRERRGDDDDDRR
jgi:uncharacterized membrane protein